MIDLEKLLEMADDIKSTIHEKQEQTVFDYKVYSICCQVQAMLKEQEAQPVKVEKNAYNHEFYYCPRCDRSFYELYYGKPKFCDKCGQEVKWNEIGTS